MITRLLFLLALTALTASAQVMLPHRHFDLQSASVTPPGVCGTPPVTTDLVQWLCVNAFTTKVDGDAVDFWPDASPKLTNGVYWSSTLFGGGGLIHPRYFAGGANGLPFIAFGDNTEYAPIVNSNAWWTGSSAAEIFYVIDSGGLTWTDGGFNHLGGSGFDDMLWAGSQPGDQAIMNFGSTVTKGLGFGFKGWNGPIVLGFWSAASDWGCLTNTSVAYSTNVNTVGWPASAATAIVAGCTYPTGFPVPYKLYEVLIYTNKLSDSDMTNTVNWLRGKYAF